MIRPFAAEDSPATEGLRACIVQGRTERLGDLLAQAVAERTARGLGRGAAAVSLLNAVLWPSMAEVCAQFGASQVILPCVLRSAEVMRRALTTLEPLLVGQAGSSNGTVVVATLAGDVHDIGKALLITILETNGYTVHDLGKQVPVDAIVDAVIALDADAVGLSALLVSTSRQMPICVQELDRRGVHVPVLIGGAAINRAFGRRAGLLPDGRVYEPAVFYCRDVFEGLAYLDAALDGSRREGLLAQVRAEINAERLRPDPPIVAAVAGSSVRGSAVEPAAVPTPPFWGARRVGANLRQVWAHLDLNTLFRYHWGGYRAQSADRYERIVREIFEPRLASLQLEAERDGWLTPLIVSGYFPCAAAGNQLVLFDPDQREIEVARLEFPRQPDGERLCLADYFRPDGDVVVLQAVSVGPWAGARVEQLQQAGEYELMLYVNGLASATAEALAEFAQELARRELGLAAGQGKRFSWGYPACPDLEEQRKVLPLLRAEADIGLSLSASANLDPEHSTAALVVHHPKAKYFAVRATA